MTVHDSKSLVPGAGRRSPSLFAPVQRELDRVLADIGSLDFNSPLGGAPRMDLRETEEGVELSAELPGVEEKDLKVEFADDVLTISGEKRSDADRKDGGYHFMERRYGAVSRSLRLPGVDGEKRSATLKDGVMTLAAPRKAGEAASKIRVPIKRA